MGGVKIEPVNRGSNVFRLVYMADPTVLSAALAHRDRNSDLCYLPFVQATRR